jgi:hypothetical protein
MKMPAFHENSQKSRELWMYDPEVSLKKAGITFLSCLAGIFHQAAKKNTVNLKYRPDFMLIKD